MRSPSQKLKTSSSQLMLSNQGGSSGKSLWGGWLTWSMNEVLFTRTVSSKKVVDRLKWDSIVLSKINKNILNKTMDSYKQHAHE